MKQIDPFTKEEFIPKKISQKYACPSNRIKHNNLKASKLRQERAFLDKPVNKNQLIIREIYVEDGKNIFHKMWLKGKGLRLDATNRVQFYKGKHEYCVYNYMLINIGTDYIKIIKI
jgi:hypothetical protein